MFALVRWRLFWILALLVMCGFALMPDRVVDEETGESTLVWPLKLGLDLQGGMHLALEIDESAVEAQPEDEDAVTVDDAIQRMLTVYRNRIDEFGVQEPDIRAVGDRIVLELAGVTDRERARRIATQTAFMELTIVTDGTEFVDALERIDRAIVASVGADNLRAPSLPTQTDLEATLGLTAEDDEAVEDDDPLGLRDPQDEGDDQEAEPQDGGEQAAEPDSAIEGEADSAAATTDEIELRPLTAVLASGGGMSGELLVAQQDQPTVEEWLGIEGVQEALPRGVALHWGTEERSIGGASYIPLYVLEADPLVTGDLMADAGPATRDPNFNRPIVPFEMTRRGARVFERGTAANLGRSMAIVLDGRVTSVATIQGVLSRRAQIELAPGASFQEAQDLALVLRAGALPMPIQVVEERTVSASLGEDSIRQGRIAFIIGIAGVIILMALYYRSAGLLAIGALVVYVILMMGGLAGLQATLTLPGIAGLILSIGMAVDANVLIFERIREELAAGKTPRTALDAGFGNALSAIVDANLTTLITGMILFQFGTGPVQGFAVTLCIGILASFFSAIYVTRTLFIMYLNRRGSTESISI